MKPNGVTVYQLGPSFKTQGGISSVLLVYSTMFAEKFTMKFIPTYSGKNRILDFILFTCALIRVFFICLNRGSSVFHIHSSTYGSFFRKSILARLCITFGMKVIFHIHGADFDEFIAEAPPRKKAAIIKLLNSADALVVLSESWKGFFSRFVSPEKIVVIYNPIRDTAAEYTSRRNRPVKILFMGRMGDRKGTYDLVSAVKLMLEKGFLAQGHYFTVRLYGDGELKKVRTLVEKLGLQAVTSINGWVAHSKVTPIYDDCDILVLPSYAEGLPMSVIEAMGRGLPVVTTDVGGIPEAVTDGENGFIIKPGDIGGLADKLGSLVKDPALREKMGRRSLELAHGRFSADAVAQKLTQLYDRLM